MRSPHLQPLFVSGCLVLVTITLLFRSRPSCEGAVNDPHNLVKTTAASADTSASRAEKRPALRAGDEHPAEGPYAGFCRDVMQRLLDSKPAAVWPPRCPVPADLKAAYERPDGSMPITRDLCMAQRYEGHKELQWTRESIEEVKTGLKNGSYHGSYGPAEAAAVTLAVNTYASEVAGKRGMVLGTELPWVEGILLNAGSAEVWTFEYASINSTHPQVITPGTRAVAAQAIAGTLPLMDYVATFSSIEHSGMGRYGDELNPEGDVEALAQAWCMMKPGGLLLLGLPLSCQDKGFIEFNAHRVYGWARLAYITDGFEKLGFAGDSGCVGQGPIMYRRLANRHRTF